MASRKRSSRKVPSIADTPFPTELRNTLQPLIGDECNALETALNEEAPISFRVNPAKRFEPGTDAVPWCRMGYYLHERPSFTFDPLLHAGAYYVQEAASMFLEQALLASGLQSCDVRALDLAAAPGGKTTHLRSLLMEGSLVVANEIDDGRRNALQENLWKWGYRNVVISGSDPKELLRTDEFFDVILVDAPCSGEGMFRKDPFARSQWNPALVQQCATIQQRILPQAWHALAPGGTLIYSTCTWEPQENEAQVARLLELGGSCIDIPLDPAWKIERCTLHGVIGYRCYPHRVKGEGFFLSAIRKPGLLQGSVSETTTHDLTEVDHWLLNQGTHSITELNDELFAVDLKWGEAVQQLKVILRNVIPGIPIALKKGNEWRPHPALALNRILDPGAFTTETLNREQAIRYLRGEALPATAAQGVALATYNGLGIGWLQGAGNRWNNRWPTSWRIRSQQPNAPLVSWAALPNEQ